MYCQYIYAPSGCRCCFDDCNTLFSPFIRFDISIPLYTAGSSLSSYPSFSTNGNNIKYLCGKVYLVYCSKICFIKIVTRMLFMIINYSGVACTPCYVPTNGICSYWFSWDPPQVFEHEKHHSNNQYRCQ